jgi:hypothetical protein
MPAVHALKLLDHYRGIAQCDGCAAGESKPLVLAFKDWLEQQLERVSTKAMIADDIRYRRDTPDNAGAPADHAQTCGARYLGIFAANSWGSTSTRTAFTGPTPNT